MGCGNTKPRQPRRASGTCHTAAQQNVTWPQFCQTEPQLQQYQQNQVNTMPTSSAIQPSAAPNNNYDTNNAVINDNTRPQAYTTTTNTATGHTISQQVPSALWQDVEVVPHEQTYNYDPNNGEVNVYASQQPPSVQPSEVKITHVETLPQQQQQLSLSQPSKPAVNNNNNNNNSSTNINNGERAVGKERANTIIDENGQEVRLPKGNWFKAQGTQYYYSAIENLYYHPPSKQFYDPTNEMWYDPSTREWYHDDTTEDDSAVLRGQHSAH